MEMLIKMVAMGISNAPQAYLADYWNRLDCFIVIAGGLEYVLDIGNVNLTSIRTVRVLRPLRAINRIPSKWKRAASLELERVPVWLFRAALDRGLRANEVGSAVLTIKLKSLLLQPPEAARRIEIGKCTL